MSVWIEHAPAPESSGSFKNWLNKLVNIVNRMGKEHAVDGTHMAPAYRCALRRVAAQSIPDTTWTDISWDTEDDDPGAMWSNANPTKIYLPKIGLYLVTAWGPFESAAGRRVGQFTLNDVANFRGADFTLGAAAFSSATTSGIIYSSAITDYITWQVYQASGAALNIPANGATLRVAFLGTI